MLECLFEYVQLFSAYKQSPQNGGQQFNASLTHNDFAQMSLEEQTNLYRQNPDLYNKLK